MPSFLCGSWGSDTGPYVCKHFMEQLSSPPPPLLTGVVSRVSLCTPDTESSPGPTLGPQLLLLIHGQTRLSPRTICSCSFNLGSNSGPLCSFHTCSPVAPFLLLFCPHVSSTLLPLPLPILEWTLLSFQLPGVKVAHPQTPLLILCPHPLTWLVLLPVWTLSRHQQACRSLWFELLLLTPSLDHKLQEDKDFSVSHRYWFVLEAFRQWEEGMASDTGKSLGYSPLSPKDVCA